MAFEDGVPGQLGTILSGLLLLTAARILEPAQVFWLGAILAAVTLLITIAIRQRYATSLLATLRRGSVSRSSRAARGSQASSRRPMSGPC